MDDQTKYIKITNKGLILRDDLILIGSSSKRGVDGKIGMFGSGWKYALAYLIRNEVDIKIFSGTTEIKVDYVYKLHRDNPVRVITVDGIETSLTAEMGPQWKEWMAFREIFSNAIDEGDHTITFGEQDMGGCEDISTIYIDEKGMGDLIENFDRYFSFKRIPIYENNGDKIFLNTEAIGTYHFRKGIRCYGDSWNNRTLSFDFNDIAICEDRLAATWDVKRQINYIMKECKVVNIVKLMITNLSYQEMCSSYTDTIHEAIKELVDEGCEFSTATLARLYPIKDAIVIQGDLFMEAVKRGIVKSPFDKMIKEGLKFLFMENLEYQPIAKNINYYLSNIMNIDDIKIGKMDEPINYKVKEDIEGIKTYSFYINEKQLDGNPLSSIDIDIKAKEFAAKCLIAGENVEAISKLLN